MNKIVFRLTSFVLFAFLLAGFCAEKSFADDPVRKEKFKAFVMFSGTTTVLINHADINRVSVNMRLLVAVGTVTLSGGSLEIDSMAIEYYTDNDASVKTSSAAYKNISAGAYSFETEPVSVDVNAGDIYYRILAGAKDGSFGYYPSSYSYVAAGLYQTESLSVGSSGNILVMQSGYQTRGDSNIVFSDDPLRGSMQFSIKELYPDDSSIPAAGNFKPLITYYFYPENFTASRSHMPSITLYYGDLPKNNNNIEVRWWDDSASKWVKVNSENNTDRRTVTLHLSGTGTGFGYYAVLDRIKLKDNDYRPLNRSFMPGESIEFRNLSEGDTVTIYNLRGKKVMTLSRPDASGRIIWNGR
ncbi:MAG: hypothetical protein FWH43_06290, partial [Endomicrobia bacterium]|nr:hypothetical protein [Endomicrobiia bacterium]